MPAIDQLVNFVGIQGLNGEVPQPAVLEAIGVGADDSRCNQHLGLKYLAALTQKKSPLIQLLEVGILDFPTPQEI